MNHTFKSALFSLFFVGISLSSALAQEPTKEEKEAAYTKVINERAAKIVANLGLTDPKISAHVQETIAQQYRNLNAIHESRKTALTGLTDQPQKEAVESETANKLTALHKDYLAALSHDLTPQQIDQVKDGMTYGVVPITFKGYQSMLPDLTDEQKNQIMAWLTEARERAMDEGTSEKKHAMFGKYKGRINNYLSAAGIDMKKASKEWEERIAREAGKTKK